MKATYGDIAGWNIGEFTDEEGTYTGSLSKEAGGYRVFLRSDCDKDEKENPLLNSVAIGVKKYDPATQKGEYQFYVDHKGTLFAQDAIIHGKIIANKGGRIGGWQLTDGETGYLHSTGTYPLYLFGNGDGTAMINGNQIENLTFRVGNTGKNADNTWKNTDTATFGITTDGKVYAGEGNIAGWTMGTFEDINTYNNSLYSDAGDYRVFLRSNSSPGQVAFGVKKYENGSNKKDYNYTFCV